MISRDDCVELDGRDELGALRAQFVLDDALIYLDGNSLGPVSASARRRVSETVDVEWSRGLVRGWGDGWMAAPTRVGDRIAGLIGARPGEVDVYKRQS